jgi:hypothetical protein
MPSAVLIIPEAQRDKANALGEALGHGPNNYSVALSPTGSEPATHWGGRGEVTDDFIAMIADAAQGNPPDGLDFPLADLAEVLGALIADFRADADGHFADVLEAHGLQMVEPPLW